MAELGPTTQQDEPAALPAGAAAPTGSGWVMTAGTTCPRHVGPVLGCCAPLPGQSASGDVVLVEVGVQLPSGAVLLPPEEASSADRCCAVVAAAEDGLVVTRTITTSAWVARPAVGG